MTENALNVKILSIFSGLPLIMLRKKSSTLTSKEKNIFDTKTVCTFFLWSKLQCFKNAKDNTLKQYFIETHKRIQWTRD